MDVLPTKELVIAAYNRDLDWLETVAVDVSITVYRKGEKRDDESEIFIEKNKGRCVHTFFTHIYNRYDSLADYTYFAQDYPFDHWSNIIECVNNTVEEASRTVTINSEGYYGYSVTVPFFHRPAQQVGSGIVFVCDGIGNPHHHGVEVEKYWRELFITEPPEAFEFNPGGHFFASKQCLLSRSKDFYEKVLSLLEDEELAPYAIERLECYIFNSNFKTKL